MAGEIERIIVEVASTHDGVCRRVDLLARGVSRSAIDRRIRGGLLQPIGAGLYLVAGFAAEPRAVAAAALLAAPSGALSHWTAAASHGFPLQASGAVHVVVPRNSHVRRLDLDVVVHESRSLTASDLTIVNDLRVTTAARTICDLAASLRPARLRHLCEQRLVLGAPTAAELVACHAALARRGRAGTSQLRLVLDELLDDEPFPQSELEVALLKVLISGRLTGFERQYRPPWFDGARGIVDFAHRSARLVLEADGRRWHTTRQAFDDDRRRDRLAAVHGWRVLRFGWQEIVLRPEQVLLEITGVLEWALRDAA